MKAVTRVLCFGDSNTWGYRPEDGSRYPLEVRWPGVLQGLLGADYQVIEEGLNGRTTNMDYADRAGRNGYEYLIPCLESHYPIDVVILALGANDTKVIFNRSAKEIAAGMEKLIHVVRGEKAELEPRKARVILVAPSDITEGVGDYGVTFKGASRKIEELSLLYAELAKRHQLECVSLYGKIAPSPADGVHLSPEMYAKIAELIAAVMLGKS